MLDLTSWSLAAKEALRSDETGMGYLTSRGILGSVIEDYDIGFTKRFFPLNSDIDESSKWNQTFCSGKFPSVNKLIFPHYDDSGKKVISFSTRSISSKYYSHFIPEYASFKGALWGWKQALPSIWKSRNVIITEGIFDLLSLSHIRRDVVCTLTRTLTEGQFRRILRYVDSVVLAFDMDDPGRKGCEIWCDKFIKEGKMASILEYKYKDLNEWWTKDPKNMILSLRL